MSSFRGKLDVLNFIYLLPEKEKKKKKGKKDGKEELHSPGERISSARKIDFIPSVAILRVP